MHQNYAVRNVFEIKLALAPSESDGLTSLLKETGQEISRERERESQMCGKSAISRKQLHRKLGNISD
jgi:hypothetical protein